MVRSLAGRLTTSLEVGGEGVQSNRYGRGGEADYKSALRWLGMGMVVAGLAMTATGEGRETVTNEWLVDTRYAVSSSPALGKDGTIYFGTWDGKLWALNTNGTRKWVFRTGSEIRSSPAVGSDGTIYVGSRDRKFYCVSAEGKKKWVFETGGWVDSSPGLAQDGTIYFGSWDRNFYALNPNGTEKWKFPTGGVVASSPAIGADGTIYFGSHDRKLYAVGPDGKKRWDFATGGQIISSPALDKDEAVYITSVDGWFYALNQKGSLRWRLKTGGITESSPVIGMDGDLGVGVNKEYWFISAEGKKLVAGNAGEWLVASPVALGDGTICFVNILQMAAVDTRDNWRWSYWLGSAGLVSPAVDPGGMIYTPYMRLGFDGFAALRTHVPLARTSWPKFRGNARNTGNVSDGVE